MRMQPRVCTRKFTFEMVFTMPSTVMLIRYHCFRVKFHDFEASQCESEPSCRRRHSFCPVIVGMVVVMVAVVVVRPLLLHISVMSVGMLLHG